MALSARADWKESPGHLVEMQVAPGVTIYDGALVGIESGAGTASQSLVTKWSDSEDLVFFGLARVTPTSSGDTGDSARLGLLPIGSGWMPGSVDLVRIGPEHFIDLKKRSACVFGMELHVDERTPLVVRHQTDT